MEEAPLLGMGSRGAAPRLRMGQRLVRCTRPPLGLVAQGGRLLGLAKKAAERPAAAACSGGTGLSEAAATVAEWPVPACSSGSKSSSMEASLPGRRREMAAAAVCPVAAHKTSSLLGAARLGLWEMAEGAAPGHAVTGRPG